MGGVHGSKRIQHITTCSISYQFAFLVVLARWVFPQLRAARRNGVVFICFQLPREAFCEPQQGRGESHHSGRGREGCVFLVVDPPVVPTFTVSFLVGRVPP